MMITTHLVAALHDQFLPGHIIDLFNSTRREQQFLRMRACIPDSNADSLRNLLAKLETDLCHPLLLPAAIAGSLVGISSHTTALNAFLMGDTLHQFADLLALPDLAVLRNPDQARRFIQAEQAYLGGLYSYVFDNFRKGGKNQSAHCLHEPLVERLLARCYSAEGIQSFANDIGISPHIVRWAAWELFNAPVLIALPAPERTAVLQRYGFERNSNWQHAIEMAEYQLNRLNAEFNAAAAGRNRQTIKEAAARVTIAQHYLHRSQRLYWWNPCELSAKDFSRRFTEVFIEAFNEQQQEGGVESA